MVRGVTSDLQTRRIAAIHKRLVNLQRNAPLSSRKLSTAYLLLPLSDLRISVVFPHLLEDTRRYMETWGQSGKLDPFDKVYEVSVTTSRSYRSVLQALAGLSTHNPRSIFD